MSSQTQTKYQAKQLVEALQYISLSLKTVESDVSLLAESVGTPNSPKIDLEAFAKEYSKDSHNVAQCED